MAELRSSAISIVLGQLGLLHTYAQLCFLNEKEVCGENEEERYEGSQHQRLPSKNHVVVPFVVNIFILLLIIVNSL